MMFGSFVFWALLLAVGVYAVVQLGRPADQRGNAKAILDERLARGDIDQEEYRSRLDLLKA